MTDDGIAGLSADRWSRLRDLVLSVLRRQLPTIILAVTLWAVMIAVGYGAGLGGSRIIESDDEVASVALWWEIFSNNAGVTFGLFSGVICLGITTLPMTATSATLLGAMSAQAIALHGGSAFVVHVGPHLVPEMAALVLSTAAGSTSLVALMRRWGGWAPRVDLPQALRDAMTLQLLAVALLILAATIETWVST